MIYYTNYTKYLPQCQEKIILNVLFLNSFLVIPVIKIKSPILRNYHKVFKNVKYILHSIYPIVRWNYGCNRPCIMPKCPVFMRGCGGWRWDWGWGWEEKRHRHIEFNPYNRNTENTGIIRKVECPLVRKVDFEHGTPLAVCMLEFYIDTLSA